MRFLNLFLVVVPFWFSGTIDPRITGKEFVEIEIQESVKDQAFKVLIAKCNVCHATKKRTDVFTIKNMDSLAPDIYRQVFIKKKMPKGRKVKLSEDERLTLENWLSAVVNTSDDSN